MLIVLVYKFILLYYLYTHCVRLLQRFHITFTCKQLIAETSVRYCYTYMILVVWVSGTVLSSQALLKAFLKQVKVSLYLHLPPVYQPTQLSSSLQWCSHFCCLCLFWGRGSPFWRSVLWEIYSASNNAVVVDACQHKTSIAYPVPLNITHLYWVTWPDLQMSHDLTSKYHIPILGHMTWSSDVTWPGLQILYCWPADIK